MIIYNASWSLNGLLRTALLHQRSSHWYLPKHERCSRSSSRSGSLFAAGAAPHRPQVYAETRLDMEDLLP